MNGIDLGSIETGVVVISESFSRCPIRNALKDQRYHEYMHVRLDPMGYYVCRNKLYNISVIVLNFLIEQNDYKLFGIVQRTVSNNIVFT